MRRFVVAFLLVFCATALAETNHPWPLTGWRLFSSVRGPTQGGWQAVLVDAESGVERPIPFGSLPRGYRGSLHVLERFPAMAQSERDAVCAAWLEGARAVGVRGSAVRVYRTQSTVSLGVSPPTTVRTRELRYTC